MPAADKVTLAATPRLAALRAGLQMLRRLLQLLKEELRADISMLLPPRTDALDVALSAAR
jgi:hypothetical protein